MNLRKGIVTVDGYDIVPETTPEDIKKNIDNDKLKYVGSKTLDCFLISNILTGGLKSTINITYNLKKLIVLRIYPLLEDPFEMPMEERQAAQRKISDEWLKEQLGDPDFFTPEVTRYQYEWGDISAYSSFDGKDSFEYGYIEMMYC